MAPVAVVCLFVASGCSQERKTLAEIDAAYRAEDYREAVALCRHAVRRNVASGKVYYYYGASLLALNRDFEGFRELEKATELEPELRTDAGLLVFGAGEKDLTKGYQSRATRRLREAIVLDPAIDLGRHRFMVADEYFRDKNFEDAASMYREAIELFADDPNVERSYLNMALSQAEFGAYSESRETLENLLTLYPHTRHRSEARWKLATMTFDDAEKQYVLGNYEEAVELLSAVMGMTTNRGLSQKTRFLLGETYEAMGQFDEAYEQYRAVIDEDRGASGRIVERAREKIAAFREAGLY